MNNFKKKLYKQQIFQLILPMPHETQLFLYVNQ